MGYNQNCREEYENKLTAALKELGFTRHNFSTPSGPWNHLVDHTCYDCRWCGALISGLDTHIMKCQAMPRNLQHGTTTDVERAKEIIHAKLEERRNVLTPQELEHLRCCGWGPHVDRITLMALCEDAGICAYAYDKAERELAEAEVIDEFTVSAYPEHDLQIMLPPQPEPAGV